MIVEQAMRVIRCWACLLLVVSWTSAAIAAEVQPNDPSSHERFLEQLNESRNRTRKEIIARYDAYLAAHPNDARTAIERCAFMQHGIDDQDEDETPADAKIRSDDLEERYGDRPEVVLFRLRSMWGDDCIQYGKRALANPTISFEPPERAAVLGLMAEREHLRRHLKEANQFGTQAEELDPTYDASLVIADYLRSVGQRQRAIDVLRAHLADDPKAHSLASKARMLFDLDDPEHALQAIRASKERGTTFIDAVFEGRVLAAVGDTDGARAAFAKQAKWNQREVLTSLFYLDLEKRDATAAAAAYRALRDQGWSADPLGRHRLALLRKHPALPWQLRDLTSLFGFLLAIAIAALAPAFIAIPVHYAGLVRRSHGAAAESTRWTLRHAWLAGSLLIFAGFVALYLFAYDELAAIMGSAAKANLTERQLARFGVASLLANALAALLFTRRAEWQRVAPSAWFTSTTFRTAGRFFGILFVVAWFNRWIVSLIFPATSAAENEGIALSTLECLRAIRHVYGVTALFFVAAIVTPLGEELLFRGVLLDGIRRHISFRWANALQAVLFAVVHDDLRMAPFLITMGIMSGILRRNTGSLATGTVLHAINNLLASIAIAAGVAPR